MDWTSFAFGTVTGMLLIVGTVMLVAWRSVPPFIKAARKSSESGKTLNPDLLWPPHSGSKADDWRRGKAK